MNVLLLGNEQETTEKVQLAIRFRWPDSQFRIAPNVDAGIDVIVDESFDLAIYCPDAQHKSHTDVCSQIREVSEIPLIVVAASEDEQVHDEIRALEAGADDYIRASAGLVDLVARVVALMRRVWHTPNASDKILISGPLTLNPATFEVFVNGRRVNVTGTEFNLLHLLIKNRGTVVRHRFLERSLWGDNVDRSALVKKYVHRLRQKLSLDGIEETDWIRNIYGVGYSFVGPKSAEEALSLSA